MNLPSTEECMRDMFTKVHGELTGSCELAITDEYSISGVAAIVYKNGNECWRKTQAELTFEYVCLTQLYK